MTLANFLTVVGWIVGPLIAASISYVLKQETKVVTWFSTEANLFGDAVYANQVGNWMGARIQFLIDGQETTKVSYLSVYVGNKGRRLKNLRLFFKFPGASIYKHRWKIDGIYSSNLKARTVWRDAIELEVSYMDKHQAFEGNFLLTQYTPGQVSVQATSPDEDEIKLERYEPSSDPSKDVLDSLLPIASATFLGYLFSRVLPFIADYLTPN